MEKLRRRSLGCGEWRRRTSEAERAMGKSTPISHEYDEMNLSAKNVYRFSTVFKIWDSE